MCKIVRPLKLKVLYPLIFYLSYFLIPKKGNRILHQNDPIFILGSGRNGSTLLASLLNNHKEIFFPPEQYALPYVILNWNIGGFLFPKTFSKKAVNLFLNNKNNQNWILKKEDFKKILFNINNHKYPISIKTITDAIYLHYAGKFKKQIKYYGDHSPLNTQFTYMLRKNFPNAKFVFLVRDPRDVVLSYKKLKNNPASETNYAIWKWKESIKAYLQLKNKNYDVLLIKYEDLAQKPQVTVKEACRFLNIKYTQDMEIPVKSAMKILGAKGISFHSNLSKPISTESIGKWKHELTKDQINFINHKTIKQRKIFGYK